MQAVMDRLERFVARRRRLVLIVWLVIVVASVPFAGRQTENLTGGGFETQGSGSQLVADALGSEFEGTSAESLSVLFDNRDRDPAKLAAAVDRVEREGFEDVEAVRLNPEAAAAARASTEPVVVMPLVVEGDRDEAVDAAATMRENLHTGEEGDDLAVFLLGQSALWAGIQELSKEDLEQAEIVGLPIVLLILLFVFGSLAAAALPLALGIASVVVTGAIVFFLSQVYGMSTFVTNMASMLGIGVAVDYSLFILARYREELGNGLEPSEAREVALRTSGMAVAFSGVTVIVALAGLFLIDAKVVQSMAVGAIVVVGIAVMAAITLLPALIAALGHRVARPGRLIGRLRVKREPKPGPGFWERWTALLMRRPLPFALAATAVMLLIASPALVMKTNTAAIAMFPEDFETRVGFDIAAVQYGPGSLGPVQLVFEGNQVDDYVRSDIQSLPGVAQVSPPQRSRDGTKTLVVVTPQESPESDATVALVDRLRALNPPVPMHIGGATAQNQDDTAVISGSLWKVALFVVVLSFLVLLVVLRSVVLPIKAVLMNALSVAAAYGVLVMVFQWGWFDSVTGFESLGYVQAITPALLLAVVFGLSMDYEVFMLSRIKERFHATGDTQQAVSQGLAASAKTISSAALIMVAVFAIFAGTGVPQVKEIGVGLAVAIALDATIVRLVLVPTTMQLMGDLNWWIPKWLDRRLPDMDFESAPTKQEEVVTAA
ncbi:MMPL family transporter [Solirubrobacter sp. CPCC 204708]|uniref:MMPL family transporter n=1 Tax=Solirubrobacter deserti TaxID=2282478 RepID=A0ABT4RLB3_9ACTN|nr:MMPL family transporter [Solirubrobacter deserti]MBE2318980.1 MMPL family transporter [Solirubrobacter deserti]MDA0139295.1 MMPL family transporter [Solirubrobacter deserti]